jgi:hypothetical protein
MSWQQLILLFNFFLDDVFINNSVWLFRFLYFFKLLNRIFSYNWNLRRLCHLLDLHRVHSLFSLDLGCFHNQLEPK